MIGESLEIADLLGWAAVIFTLTAFSMRTMLPLRVAAIGSNMCFIGFGYLEGSLPILALHALLLPFNLMRLRQIVLTKSEVERPKALGQQEISGSGSREIAELRAEIVALREQLRRSTLNQTVVQGSTNLGREKIGFWDCPSDAVATFNFGPSERLSFGTGRACNGLPSDAADNPMGWSAPNSLRHAIDTGRRISVRLPVPK
jgi:hypothetical protein